MATCTTVLLCKLFSLIAIELVVAHGLCFTLHAFQSKRARSVQVPVIC